MESTVKHADLGRECGGIVRGYPSLSMALPIDAAFADLRGGGGFISDRLQQHPVPPPLAPYSAPRTAHPCAGPVYPLNLTPGTHPLRGGIHGSKRLHFL